VGEISLRPAAKDEQGTLDNLAQLYCYDWSPWRCLDVGDDGRFHDLLLERYWVDDWRHPFLVRVGDKLAGFALVVGSETPAADGPAFDMAEFFVLQRYRRQGTGRAAAHLAFSRFKGAWQVRQREENPDATAFWRRTIADCTRGDFKELRLEGPAWKGWVQTFSTR
jgi:predicted acetyltransferase